jgi:hypothetical protein
MVHPVASADDLRSIRRLGAMDEAQMILPVEDRDHEDKREGRAALLTGVQKGEEDSLLLVERDRLRRGIFAVVLRRDEPIEKAVLHSLAHLLVGPDHVLCRSEVVRCPLIQICPTPSEPCMDERNLYSTEVVRSLTQFGESVTQAIMTPGV